jgi:ATP-dependent helicase HrpB
VTSEAALVAALLAERDPFRRPAARPGEARQAARTARSDLLERADALEDFARRRRAGGPVDPGAARFVLAARDQLVREIGRDDARRSGERDDALLSSIFAAFPDRLARRREPGSPRAVMVGGRGVRLAAESALADAAVELFVAVDVDAPTGAGGGGPVRQGGEALVRLASAVELEWLPPERLSTAVEVEWDAERERVVAWKRTRYRDLVLAESEAPAASDDAERVLAEAAAERLASALPLADPAVSSLLARVRSLRRWMPELGLPAFDDGELRGLLPALAAGRRSFAEMRQAPLAAILVGALTREQRQALAREAPELLRVPSGREVRLVYEPGRPPVLAARIQELFGWTAAPRLAAGRTPVLLHLLAPNGRPQQVTDDLASFWRSGYPQVRKELRGRYPKHAWPEDPTTAPPERRPARRG